MDPSSHSQLHFENLESDAKKVIEAIASRYTDNSCPMLSYEDLVNEGLLKLSELCTKGLIGQLPGNKNPTREEWFKFFKTVVNNHVKGLVHKYRGTIKRTGHRIDPNVSNKPVEISLDDPEAGLQVGEIVDYTSKIDEKFLIEHVRDQLTPLERLVLDQLLNPNEEAWFWAVYRSLGRSPGSGYSIQIKKEDQAMGLGMELDLFLKVQKSIQQKYKNMIEVEAEDTKSTAEYNAAIEELCRIYNLQVPISIRKNKDTVARLFTMAARRETEKLTDEVKELLKLVGARPPAGSSAYDLCFGVLYEQGNQICKSCGVSEACREESKTHGIDGTIYYSPRLMGSKLLRTPVLTGKQGDGEAMSKPPVSAPQVVPQVVVEDPKSDGHGQKLRERNDEIEAFLTETFVQRRSKDDIYLDYKESSKARYIFWFKRRHHQLMLRFCNPSDALKKELEKRKNGYYLPDNITADQAIKLINRHSRERLLGK